MTKREVIILCLEFEDVYEDYPFDLLTDAPDAWTVMRHKGNRKGFAHIYGRGGQPIINLKLPPCEGDLLRQSFEDIKPAYHMNKEHWNVVNPNGDVPLEMLRGLIEKSYEMTKPKQRGIKRD
jgi:predicted DNA-binding protein (MmcQ/YjbR family)